MTGGRCSEVDLVLKLLGRDLVRSLLTGGRYSEVVVNTGLTVPLKEEKYFFYLDYMDITFVAAFLCQVSSISISTWKGKRLTSFFKNPFPFIFKFLNMTIYYQS